MLVPQTMEDNTHIFREVCNCFEVTLETVNNLAASDSILLRLRDKVSKLYEQFQHEWGSCQPQNVSKNLRCRAIGTKEVPAERPHTPGTAITKRPHTTGTAIAERPRAIGNNELRMTGRSNQPSQGVKRKVHRVQARPSKRLCTQAMSQTVPVISFSRPSCDQLPQVAKDALQTAGSLQLSESQWTYWKSRQVLPVTLQQWRELPTLLDQVQHHLDEYGAILIHPDWSHQESSVDTTLDLKINFQVIQTRPTKPQSHVVFKHATREDRMIELRDVVEEPLELYDFEQRLTRPHHKSLYANDVDMSDLNNHGIPRSLGISLQLRSLPGNELPAVTEQVFPGVNDSYLYLGERASSFYLHREDEQLYSLNMVHAGQKRWQIFQPSERTAIEQHFAKVSDNTCDQFVRHQHVYLTTDLIKNLKLHPEMITQRPGQIVITTGYAYHQGFNAQPCISEAVNYARNWAPVNYRYCESKLCHLSLPALCIFQTLQQPIRVNQYESVSVKTIMDVRARLAHARLCSEGDQSSFMTFILLIGCDSQLNALTHKPGSFVFDPASLSSAYSLLTRSFSLVQYGEVLHRLAVYYIHKHISERIHQKRKQRAHRGCKSKEISREVVIEEAISELDIAGNTQIIRQELNSYTFRHCGEAYTTLVNYYGLPIIGLLPSTSIFASSDMNAATDMSSSWLGRILYTGTNGRNKELSTLFLELLGILRPSLKSLCANGPYQQRWTQAYENILHKEH